MEKTGTLDRLTVIAIAVIAYAGANFCHEILGHCGTAAILGTKCKVISSTYIPLADELPPWKYNLIVIGGCTANWIAGLMALTLLRRYPTTQPATRYFLWLFMSVNLFLASTYVTVAPLIKFGDAYILIQNLPRQWFWRTAVTLGGAALWLLSFRVSRAELGRLIGFGGRPARRVAWNLVAPAYVAGGIVTVASAFFSQLAAKWAQLQAAGGTFGLTVWLLLLPFFLPEQPLAERPFVLSRATGWIVAGVLTALIFIGVLGRGIPM